MKLAVHTSLKIGKSQVDTILAAVSLLHGKGAQWNCSVLKGGILKMYHCLQRTFTIDTSAELFIGLKKKPRSRRKKAKIAAFFNHVHTSSYEHRKQVGTVIREVLLHKLR